MNKLLLDLLDDCQKTVGYHCEQICVIIQQIQRRGVKSRFAKAINLSLQFFNSNFSDLLKIEEIFIYILIADKDPLVKEFIVFSKALNLEIWTDWISIRLRLNQLLDNPKSIGIWRVVNFNRRLKRIYQFKKDCIFIPISNLNLEIRDIYHLIEILTENMRFTTVSYDFES